VKPWETIGRFATREGLLELRRRGEREFLIVVDGRVLMTSSARRSEEALATLAIARMPSTTPPSVLVAGLGMGYTLRAALDVLPARSRVVVAELHAGVVEWCRGPLAELTAAAVDDPRVEVAVDDVTRVIAASPARSLDAILLDLYEGPYHAATRQHDPLFGATALGRAHQALREGGVLAIWSEDPADDFPPVFRAAGFEVSVHRAGKGGRQHVVYLGVAMPAPR
jgi:spermidine synthase